MRSAWLSGFRPSSKPKKLTVGPHGVLTQAERYSRGIQQQPRYQGEYGVPFLYSTNGEQIRFHDVRCEHNRSRWIAAFHTPQALARCSPATLKAVREEVTYLKPSSAAIRRGAGGAIVEQVDGFIPPGIGIAHRGRGPQLHTHVLVANLGQGRDGRWSALNGRRIYAHANASSRVYQAVLRGELTRALGMEWTLVQRGTAELPGEVIRAFSRRRAQIEMAMSERGTSGLRAVEVAALRHGEARTGS
jgi:hypothetical protein